MEKVASAAVDASTSAVLEFLNSIPALFGDHGPSEPWVKPGAASTILGAGLGAAKSNDKEEPDIDPLHIPKE